MHARTHDARCTHARITHARTHARTHGAREHTHNTHTHVQEEVSTCGWKQVVCNSEPGAVYVPFLDAEGPGAGDTLSGQFVCVWKGCWGEAGGEERSVW